MIEEQKNAINLKSVVMPQTIAPVSPNNSIDTMNQVNTPQTINNAPAQTPVSTPKKSQKKLIMTMVILAVLLLLGAGSAAAYYFYYNSDTKILSDAWQKIMTAESVSFASNSTSQLKIPGAEAGLPAMNLKVKTAGLVSYQAQELKVDLQMETLGISEASVTGEVKHTQNDGLFVQVSGLESVIEGIGLGGLIDVSNLENQWIRIGTEIIDEYAANIDLEWQQLSECLQNNWQAIRMDKTINQELLQAVIKSNFLTYQRLEAQKIEGETAIGYEVTIDRKQVPALVNNVKQTQAYQLMTACYPLGELETANIEEGLAENTSKTTVWLNQKTHEPVRVATEVKYEETLATDVTDLKLNAPVEVQSPAEYQKVEEVMGMLFGNSFNPAFAGMGGATLEQVESESEMIPITTVNMQGESLTDYPANYSLQACTEPNDNEYSSGVVSRSQANLPGMYSFRFGVLVSCDAIPTDYRVETVYDESIDTLYIDLLNDKTYAESDCTCVMNGEGEVHGLSHETKKVLLNEEMGS